ncbi:alpha/beta hydrolase [Prauserella cavernicola]|uniref:Alpha/beta fold hydrolase n=1 Tax=Prauserella cavernicola TaxID=2800127 RepID=A0A934V7U4_9PSEU|nr:alpha/beta hydrolase [Prauserella cavernicola]MBK1787078.1 alpha/beta fold hydrolase [Prauserella cavernicola]
MRKPVLAVLAAAVVAALTPAGVSVATEEPAPPDTLSWGACPADSAKPGLECATIDVPLDYRDPDGETIEVAVSRLASADPEKRRGVLLTNTGGPGGAGLSFPAVLRDNLELPQDVLDSYDIIGMDPRGVAHSTPVTCEVSLLEHPTNIPTYARNAADVNDEAERVAGVAEKCGQSETAPLLPHITTANTARDMDRIRAALGEEKVSYFGISYGTYLGSVYTSMFPERSDRFLIDSATGPQGWDSSFSRMFGQGVEDRFPDFARFAAEHPEYGLGTTPGQVRAKYFEIAAKLDAEPSPDGYTGAVFRHVTFADFYYDSSFPALAETWQALDTGNPVPVPDVGEGEQAPPETGIPSDNYQASQLHVICNDSAWPEDVKTYQRNVALDRFRHPMFGAAGANISPCAFWPSEPVEPQVEITDEGPSNVLILQNLRDPATPLAGAEKLREAFGDRARMVTADQGGHLAYLYLDNQCLNDLATDFLVTGERPQRDVACGAESA